MMRCRSLAASSSARTFRHRCWTPPPRRLASTAAATPLPSEGALTVACGIAFFVAAERSTGAALSACEMSLPSHVTALCVLGGFAAVPSIGVHLQRTLGPAAAWLRASLPCTLVPAFLFPAMCELPSGDALPKLAALAAGSAILTCAATGHIAAALVRGVPQAVATPCIRSVSAAAAVSSSPRFAFAALTFGSLLSAAIYTWHPAASAAVARAPAYIGGFRHSKTYPLYWPHRRSLRRVRPLPSTRDPPVRSAKRGVRHRPLAAAAGDWRLGGGADLP